MNNLIKDINIEKILDSRGNVTVEIEIITENGYGRAAAPSGASTGVLEVSAFPNEGIDFIIKNFDNIISKKLIGSDVFNTRNIDSLLKKIDGTSNFSYIGGNIAVAISLASIKAVASSYNLDLYAFLGGNLKNKLPYPLGNMINGGAHAGKNAPDIQEFLVIPTGANTFYEAVLTNSKVHTRIGELITKKDSCFTKGKGDEGGWAPNLSNYQCLEIQSIACEEITDETGICVRPGLDLAPSNMWNGSKYVYSREAVERDSDEQIDFIEEIIKDYNMFYIEDPFHETDFESFQELTKRVSNNCLICGDDIFVTNSDILEKGIEMGVCNSIIIKPNQIGTLTDTLKTIDLAKNNNYIPVISHRSGETTDNSISHLAVAFECPLIKTGALGGERISKLNELIRIEKNLTDPIMNNNLII